MVDFKDELKRAAADELVRWGRYIVIGLVAFAFVGGITYFYGGAIKRATVSTITWPWTATKEKAGDIGKKTIEKSKEIKEKADEGAQKAKEGAGDAYDAAKKKAGELTDKAKEKAGDVGGSISERWRSWRGKKPEEPETPKPTPE